MDITKCTWRQPRSVITTSMFLETGPKIEAMNCVVTLVSAGILLAISVIEVWTN